MTDSDDLRWQAVAAGDMRAAGRFVYGRAADGTYHSPICRQRPADRDGITFFDTAAAARADGFTPCADCHPDQAGWLVGAGRWM